MKLLTTGIATALSAVVLLAGISSSEAREVPIYAGEALSSAKITLAAWGSGTASENTKEGVIGSRSIQVTTPGLFAGAFINLGQPVEIADPGVIGKYDYLAFTIKFKTTTPLGLSSPNNAPNPTGEYRALPPSADTYGYYSDDIPQVPKVRKVRAMLDAVDGRSVEHTGLVVQKPTDEEGWIVAAMPLLSFGIGKDGKGFPLSKIALSADYPDTLWVGQIRVITDDSPIYLNGLEAPSDVSVQDRIIMKGQAEAGQTPITYSWDFNSSDGLQEDAVGQIVEVVYKTSGTYTITLTAKDPDGIKAPASITTEISVE